MQARILRAGDASVPHRWQWVMATEAMASGQAAGVEGGGGCAIYGSSKENQKQLNFHTGAS